MRATALVVLSLVGASVSPAFAETHSVSYSDWTITGELTTLKFVLPVVEAQRLAGIDVPLATTKKVGEYLLAHTAVEADGASCAPLDQGYDIGLVDPLAVGAGSYGFEIFFKCDIANPRVRVLKNTALFDRVPAHVNFARVRAGVGDWVPQLFTASRTELSVPSGSAPRGVGFWRYTSLGFAHVLGSFDRICIVLGLLLLVRKRQELGLLAVGLAGGYALAWLESAGGWLAPRAAPLEGLLGFMVLWLAAELVARETNRAKVAAALVAASLGLAAIASFSAGWASALVLTGCALLAGGLLPMTDAWIGRRAFWVATAATLGFLDGYVLPPELAPVELPKGTVLPLLAGFDVGALVAAAFVAALAVGAVVVLRRRRIAVPRALVGDLAAAALGGCGAFWVVSRFL